MAAFQNTLAFHNFDIGKYVPMFRYAFPDVTETGADDAMAITAGETDVLRDGRV